MALSNVFAADADLDLIAAAIERDGYAVIQQLLPMMELDSLRAELRPYLERTPLGTEDFGGTRPSASAHCLKNRRPRDKC